MTAREQRRARVLTRVLVGQLTMAEGGVELGLSERQLWRLRAAFSDAGPAGLVHGNRGRASPQRIHPDRRIRIIELRERYGALNDTHFGELLAEREGIMVSRESLHAILRGAGIASPRRRRPPRYRSRRPRMGAEGTLLQLDGSRHRWLEKRGPELVLVGAIDDATGWVTAALFRDQEDAAGYLEILRTTIDTTGCRGPSIATVTVPSPRRTRAGPVAMAQIHSARSDGPWPSSGSTRSWPAHPRPRAGSSECGAPSRIGWWSSCAWPGSATGSPPTPSWPAIWPATTRASASRRSTPWRPGGRCPTTSVSIGSSSWKYRRKVARDHTISLDGRILQLPRGATGAANYAGKRVEVHVALDGSIVAYDGERRLAVLSARPIRVSCAPRRGSASSRVSARRPLRSPGHHPAIILGSGSPLAASSRSD